MQRLVQGITYNSPSCRRQLSKSSPGTGVDGEEEDTGDAQGVTVLQACSGAPHGRGTRPGGAEVIQQRFRAGQAARLQRRQYFQQRRSALVLQAAFRGMRIRRRLKRMHASATLIQSRFRSVRVEEKIPFPQERLLFLFRGSTEPRSVPNTTFCSDSWS